jgi:hypothetical protein
LESAFRCRLELGARSTEQLTVFDTMEGVEAMSQTHRAPRLGEIVLYHERLRQDIWEPPQLVTWPAIVTEVLPPHPGEVGTSVRLTAFRPFDKPHWDITAHSADEPKPGCWTWRDPAEAGDRG